MVTMIPAKFAPAIVTPIYKGKGNPDEEGNYRGVSVAGTLAKMYGSILGNHHHHHHQKAFRNKSHTSHGHRPGLKRNKSKGIILTINYYLMNY